MLYFTCTLDPPGQVKVTLRKGKKPAGRGRFDKKSLDLLNEKEIMG